MQNFMVLVTAKNTNLPSFLALTPERKVQLTCAWSHFVGLIELQILICLGTLKHVSMIRYCPKTLKFRMMSIKLLLMISPQYFINRPRCTLSKAFLKSMKTMAALRFFAFAPSIILRSAKMCEAVLYIYNFKFKMY